MNRQFNNFFSSVTPCSVTQPERKSDQSGFVGFCSIFVTSFLSPKVPKTKGALIEGGSNGYFVRQMCELYKLATRSDRFQNRGEK
jgi:hypothetical protein